MSAARPSSPSDERAGGDRWLVRPAAGEDLPRLVELAEAYCREDGTPWDGARRTSALAGLLADNPWGLVLVAERSTVAAVVGYLVMTWGYSVESGGLDALLDEVHVEAEHRGWGIGSALVDEAVVRARAAGASRINLETEADNERARALYRRLGWVADDSIWMDRWL